MSAPHPGVDTKKDYTHDEENIDDPNGLTREERSFLANFPEDKKKKVIRKVDWRLVPFLTLLYLFSYIDRANIGNAKIEGLVEDLGMTDDQYRLCLSIFYVPYILFGTSVWPCSLLTKNHNFTSNDN